MIYFFRFQEDVLFVRYLLSIVVVVCYIMGCETVSNIPSTKYKNTVATDSDESHLLKVIAKEEKNNGIPDGMLNSIAVVESDCTPYVVNTAGRTHKFKSKEVASQFIKSSVKNGNKNISVGCLQLHYKVHKRNFASIEDMLNPEKNISYAANLLRALYNKYGSWEKATKMYHSNKAKYNKVYYRKVMKECLKSKTKKKSSLSYLY